MSHKLKSVNFKSKLRKYYFIFDKTSSGDFTIIKNFKIPANHLGNKHKDSISQEKLKNETFQEKIKKYKFSAKR